MESPKNKRNQYSAVSLFSGCGGLDVGFKESGFSVDLANEVDPAAVETLRKNFPQTSVFDDSVEQLTKDRINGFLGKKKIDVVFGGPPCQAFSVFGKREGIVDPRGKIIFEFVRIIEQIKPKVFLLENVRGLLSTPLLPPKYFEVSESSRENHKDLTSRGSLVKKLVQEFNALGYHIDLFVVNSVNYGSPQVRERVLIFGNKLKKRIRFPAPTHSNRPEDRLPEFTTLGDIIGRGFNDPDTSVMNFSERKLKYLSMVPEGGNWRNLPIDIQKESMGKSWYLKGGRSAYWRKLSFNYPSPTVVTMPNHAGTSMCHPTELRAITVGEAAAIQEFPKDFEFQGTATEKMRQIGNAVPVGLSRIAASLILKLLNDPQSFESQSFPAYFEQHLRPHVRVRSFFRNGKSLAGHSNYYNSDTQLDLGID